MKIEKEVKPKNVDMVLVSIKKGNSTPREIIKDIDISNVSLHNALRKLCLHGAISKSFRGKYLITEGEN